jgi:hypothetical protein
MSADEFDPEIERLFGRAPHLPDAPLFTARVEQRLQQGSRVRFLALALAGAVGGTVAVRETLTLRIGGDAPVTQAAGNAVGQGIQSASMDVQGAVNSGIAQLGLSNLELGSMGGMQLFWVAAAALIALAAGGVMKLSQDF